MNRSGTMKLVLGGLLLAGLCSLWSGSSGTPHLVQTPDVSIQEGGTVNISCCWTEQYKKVRISIIRTNTTAQDRSKGLLEEKHLEKSTNCSSLTIDEITMEDSGMYVCEMTVEIPSLVEIRGKGTVVKVIPKRGGEEGKKEGLPLALKVLAVTGSLVLVALTALCLVLRRRREQVRRVIYEVPHTDPDVDKGSTGSSRGSSEWRQVPLYDYFERVKAPDKSAAVQ